MSSSFARSTPQRKQLGRRPVQGGEVVEVLDPVRLVQPATRDADARDQAEVGHLLELLAAPVPPSTQVALVADDGLGEQGCIPTAGVCVCREMHFDSVPELEVVTLHGRQRAVRRRFDVLRRIEPGPFEVVPDDHTLGAADPADVALRGCQPRGLEQPAVVGQLQQVGDVPAGIAVGVGARRLEEGRLDVRDEGGAATSFLRCDERLVGLHIDRQVAVAVAVAIAIAHEEVGFADAMRFVVDGEPATGDDPGSVVDGAQGLPLPGVGILRIDDGSLDAVEEVCDGLLLVLLPRPDQLLQEG